MYNFSVVSRLWSFVLVRYIYSHPVHLLGAKPETGQDTYLGTGIAQYLFWGLSWKGHCEVKIRKGLDFGQPVCTARWGYIWKMIKMTGYWESTHTSMLNYIYVLKQRKLKGIIISNYFLQNKVIFKQHKVSINKTFIKIIKVYCTYF